jgi:uncharacterized protein YecA (UPF0149 family)
VGGTRGLHCTQPLLKPQIEHPAELAKPYDVILIDGAADESSRPKMRACILAAISSGLECLQQHRVCHRAPDEEDRIMAQATDFIPDCVTAFLIVSPRSPSIGAQENQRKFRCRWSRDGPLQTDQPLSKLGRNEPCPCGSRKKFRKCYGKAS